MSNIISIGCEYHALWGTNFLSVKFIFLKVGYYTLNSGVMLVYRQYEKFMCFYIQQKLFWC